MINIPVTHAEQFKNKTDGAESESEVEVVSNSGWAGLLS